MEFDIIFRYCKYSEENCSGQGELTDVIKYAAELLDLRRPIHEKFRTCKVRTTEDACPNFLCTFDHDGNADSNRPGEKSSWDKLL